MNRRILLIDADADFHTHLAQQLARYRFDIDVRPDAEAAIAEAANTPPALILLAAETDKLGFKIFGKIKKSPLSRTTIILATKSLPPSDIAKHRALRIHADEYVDKRSMVEDELLHKIDNLIGLGTPIDDLDIPVEVDDVSLSDSEDGDMVLEETVGEDELAEHTIAGELEEAVAAETDAAIDALLFGDDAPSLEGQTQLGGELTGVVVDEPPADDAVPPVVDGPDEGLDSLGRESIPVPVVDVGPDEPVPERALESSPAILLEADDLQMVEIVEDGEGRETQVVPEDAREALLEASDAGSDDDSGGVPEPVPHPASQRDVDETPAREPSARLARPAPEAPPPVAERPLPTTRAVFDLGLDAIAADAEHEQSGVYDRRSLRKIHELERQVSQLTTELERARASAENQNRSSREREFVNLRQQLIAKDDEARRARTDLEGKDRELADALERIRQLQESRMALEARTAELEQRGAADASRASSLETREKKLVAQLGSVEQDLETRTQALAAAESARAQLEHDLASERATRAASASDAERTLRVEREQMIARHQGELNTLRAEHAGAQAAALERQRQEHDAAFDAYKQEQDAAREVARQQLEALRTEHATAIAAARQEYTAGLESARAAQAAERDAARADQTAAIEALRRDLEARTAVAVETAQRDVEAEAEKAIADLETRHAARIAKLDADHAGELERVRADHTGELAQLREELAGVQAERDQGRSDHASAIARLEAEAIAAQEQYAAALARVEQEHAARAASEAQAAERAAEALRAELERTRGELAELRATHDRDREQAATDHAAELAAVANQHARTLAERERAWASEREHTAGSHAAALAEIRAELDRQVEQHGVKLDSAKQELDAVIGLHEQAKQQLIADHRRAAEEQASAHASELAALVQERQRALDDAQRAAAEHERALERATEKHRDELAQTRDHADREIAELKMSLATAKKSLDEAVARHQSEREALEEKHGRAIAELEGKHERAIAVANGEVVKAKAVGDAELKRAMAAKDAEYDRERRELVDENEKLVRDLVGERDDLQRGLSGARDTIKRLDGELAAAVQTIADRNAELRTHATAIGERDQRIAELRAEIQTLESENTSYQEQVLRAYQKIKADEAKSARAKKAMAIALTALDEEAAKSDPS